MKSYSRKSAVFILKLILIKLIIYRTHSLTDDFKTIYENFFVPNLKLGQGKAYRLLMRDTFPSHFWKKSYSKANNGNTKGYYWIPQRGTTYFDYEVVQFDHKKITDTTKLSHDIEAEYKAGLVNPKIEWVNMVHLCFKKLERHFDLKFREKKKLYQKTNGDRSARRIRVIFTVSGFNFPGTNLEIPGKAGVASAPGSEYGGDVYIRVKYNKKTRVIGDIIGGENTIMHEIGHALGLSHSFLDQDEKQIYKSIFHQMFPYNKYDNTYYSIMAYGHELRSGIGPLGYVSLGILFGFNQRIKKKLTRYKLAYDPSAKQNKKFLMWREGKKTPDDVLLGIQNIFYWGEVIGTDAYILDGSAQIKAKHIDASYSKAVYLNARPYSFSGFITQGWRVRKDKSGIKIAKLKKQNSLDKLQHAWYNVSHKVHTLISGYAGGVLIGYRNPKFIVKESIGITDIMLGQGNNVCIVEGRNSNAYIYLSRHNINNQVAHSLKFYPFKEKENLYVFLPNFKKSDIEKYKKGNDLVIRSKSGETNITLKGYYLIDLNLREKNIFIVSKEEFIYQKNNAYITSIYH